MIGKYEREDNSPSIEVIVKLAKAFQVSVDYLLGEGPNASYDKDMIQCLDELETLPEEKAAHLPLYGSDHQRLQNKETYTHYSNCNFIAWYD